jgi:protein-tyrosine phosphatase
LIKHHAQRVGLDVFVESAGTSGWHQGEPADVRSIEIMHRHGHDISSQRSRALTARDLHTFDHILVMDAQNLRDVESMGTSTAEVTMFIPDRDVPDPYYGGTQGFQQVYDMIDEAAAHWIKQWTLQGHTPSK